MQFSPDGKGGYKVPGPNYTLNSIGANSYLMDMGGLKQFVFYVDTTEDGRMVLQSPGSDYVEVNGKVVILKYVLLLFIVAALYGLVVFSIDMACSIKHKKLHLVVGYRAADVCLYSDHVVCVKICVV